MADRRITDEMVTRALEVLGETPAGQLADRHLVRRALEDALLDPASAAVVTEYAETMSDGYHVWDTEETSEARIEVVRESGGRVFRRSVIVVDDWTEVTEP